LDRFKQMQAYMRQMASMPGIAGRAARRATSGGRKVNNKKKKRR
jgi:hypothetical protein